MTQREEQPALNSRLARIAAQRPVIDEAAAQATRSGQVVHSGPAAPPPPMAEQPAGGVLQVSITVPDVAAQRDRTRPVNLTWHEGFIKRFDRYCKRVGVSRSSMAEQLLSAVLDRLEAREGAGQSCPGP